LSPPTRSDHAAIGPVARLSIVDIQPDMVREELALRSRFSKCAACNFRQFLSAQPGLQRYWGLAAVHQLFEYLPALARALADRNGPVIRDLVRRVGARGCVEIHTTAVPATLALPHLIAVDLTRDSAHNAPQRRDEDGPGWMIIIPGTDGPARIVDELKTAARRGYRGVWVGHYEHAAMAERWSEFCDQPEFAAEWSLLGIRAHEAGVPALGIAEALPPCALLQRAPNRILESVRARLDLHFRTMDSERSLMCPENVSGYAVINDMRALAPVFRVGDSQLALRFENVMFTF
jgi:hypothetical protein